MSHFLLFLFPVTHFYFSFKFKTALTFSSFHREKNDELYLNETPIVFSSSFPDNKQHYNRLYLGMGHLLLLLVDLLVVEGKLVVLQNVAISATTLTRMRGDAGKNLAGSQLLDHFLLIHNRRLSLLQLGDRGLALSFHLRQVVLHNATLSIDLASVVLLEPGLERRSIDGHDATLHNRVGTHQFVVGSIVHNVQNLGLGRESYSLRSHHITTLSSPGERTSVETNSTVLQISTTATHKVNTLRTELGHSRLTTHLELSLLDVDDNLSTS